MPSRLLIQACNRLVGQTQAEILEYRLGLFNQKSGLTWPDLFPLLCGRNTILMKIGLRD